MKIGSDNSYVLFRYPNQEKQFLVNQKDGEDTFVFQSFDNKTTVLLSGKVTRFDDDIILDKIHFLSKSIPVISNETYIKHFNRYKSALTQEEIEKAILSRVVFQPNDEFDIIAIFHRLCTMYPTALVYVSNLQENGVWIGASPEKLLSYHKGKAKTVALAGTKTTNNPNAWGQKEKDEHRSVEKYIESLASKEFKLIHKSPIYLSKAGSIYHQKSDFTFEIPSHKIPHFLELLHPTPAVCGVPLQSSKQLILETESHDRELYTGFLGLFPSENSTEIEIELYVNLRCMQLTKEGAFIYVGGGITNESVGLDEWNETEEKAKTMLTVLA